MEELAAVRDALEARWVRRHRPPLCAAESMVAVPDEAGETLMKLIEVLDDHDDVQNVYATTNCQYPDGSWPNSGRDSRMATPPVQIVVRRNGFKVRTVSRLRFETGPEIAGWCQITRTRSIRLQPHGNLVPEWRMGGLRPGITLTHRRRLTGAWKSCGFISRSARLIAQLAG